MSGKALYFECANGISGDMAVAALLDAGADQNTLLQALHSLPVQGFRTEIRRVTKAGLDCCDFVVIPDDAHENHDHDMEYLFGHGHHEHHEHHEHHGHRNLQDILQILRGTDMTENARSLAGRIFRILAEAEAKAHGTTPEKVHFHEVGAVDSIADIVAFSVCFDSLGIQRVYVPHLCEGTGTVRCQHGILPIPVPAVAHIAEAYALPLEITAVRGELVTPTGAACIAAVRTDGALPPRFVIRKTGTGAGKREYERPSFLRVMVLETAAESGYGTDTVVKLETNLDDCTGEAVGFVMEELMENGALDVHCIPCHTKKNRPAFLLVVLCREQTVPVAEKILFMHTGTTGIRRCTMARTVLPRREIRTGTPYGEIRAKAVSFGGTESVRPEYESVAGICRRTGKPFGGLYRELTDFCQKNGGSDK